MPEAKGTHRALQPDDHKNWVVGVYVRPKHSVFIPTSTERKLTAVLEPLPNAWRLIVLILHVELAKFHDESVNDEVG